MPFRLKPWRTRRYNVLSKNYFVTRIRLLDSNVIECTLSVESTGQECLEAVAQRLELREVRLFSDTCSCFCFNRKVVSSFVWKRPSGTFALFLCLLWLIDYNGFKPLFTSARLWMHCQRVRVFVRVIATRLSLPRPMYVSLPSRVPLLQGPCLSLTKRGYLCPLFTPEERDIAHPPVPPHPSCPFPLSHSLLLSYSFFS